tara:strand:+ start:1055 stop:1216 length:162 start_codon:yes stop_codon:yes gene_type:complete
MSKTGNWVLEMQEDAWDMSFEQFIEKHGSSQARVWSEGQEDSEREFMEMDDGA